MNGLGKLLAAVGVPGAIAFYLLYFVTRTLQESLTKIEAAVHANTAAMNALSRFLEKLTTGP